MNPALRNLANGLLANPWLMLSLTCLFWGGNVVAARMAIDNISPMLLVTGRWGVACAILALTARSAFAADAPVLRAHWKRVTLTAIIGFTTYHTLYYVSAHYTQGVNLAILQGVTPVFVFIGGWIMWRTRVRAWQAVGCFITIFGVLIVGAHGDLSTLGALRFNLGDLGIFGASIFYAAYSLLLRNRPRASSLGFFCGLAIAAFATSLPLLALEAAQGVTFAPTLKGWLVLAYVAVFPTLLSQIFFIRSVEMVGPARATLFYNMTPALGAILATLFLDEPFAIYHLAALAFVIGGVMIAEIWGSR